MGAATPTAASSAVAPHVDDPAEPIAAGREGASAQVPQNATEPPPTTGGYDWDAATAAALTDESADRVAPPHVHTTTTADRLLEDIIREIVGDAAVDDASSQLSDQSIPSNDVVRPTTTHGSEAASPPPAVASTTNRMSRPSESTPSAPSARPLVAADENGQNATATPEAPREPTATPQEMAMSRGADIPFESAPPLEPSVPSPSSASRDPFLGTVGTAPATQIAPLSVSVAVASDAPRPAETIHENSTLQSEATTAAADTPSASPTGTLDQLHAVTEGVHYSGSPLRDDMGHTLANPAQTNPDSTDVSRETTGLAPEPPVSRETGQHHGGTPLADQLADETRRRLALDEEVLPLPASTRILTISNQKGGVGKTTTAVNLAAALARTGAHVLVIDLDPQGNASTALGVDHRSEQESVYDVLVSDLPLADVVRPSTEHERLDCVPATIHLAGAEIELVSLVAREQRLRRALDTHLVGMDRPYDYVFIDCPPSLGLLTINAFVAAREVLIPIQCEYYALEGLSQLLSNIELIEKHLNAELRLSTILLTMYDSRTNLAQQVAQEVRDHFPIQTLDTIIPRSVRVSEAPSYGQSVISYDYASSGSLSYREAAAEIARRGAAT